MNLINIIITGFMTYESCTGDKQGMIVSSVFLFLNLVVIQSLREINTPPVPPDKRK